MLVPNRHGSSDSYRYGFQGQEKDDEIKGEGNSLNYTFRMHDPRVGRFFATDPLEKVFTDISPYSFSANNPILFIDNYGAGPEPKIKAFRTTPKISRADVKEMDKVLKQAKDILNKPNPPKKNNLSPIPIGRLHPVLNIIISISTFELPTEADLIKGYYENYIERSKSYKNLSWYQCSVCVESEIRGSISKLKGLTIQASDGSIEHFGANPSELSDDYLSGVIKRIESGNARGTDWSYASEAYKRMKNSSFKSDDKENVADQKTIITFIQGIGEKAKKISVTLPDGYAELKNKRTFNNQKIYTNGTDYISPDKDGHNGGIWKKAESPEALNKKETRDGTFDQNLNKIGG